MQRPLPSFNKPARVTGARSGNRMVVDMPGTTSGPDNMSRVQDQRWGRVSFLGMSAWFNLQPKRFPAQFRAPPFSAI